MIRSEQAGQIVRQSVSRAVTKWKCRETLNLASLFKHAEIRPHGDTPQRKNHPRADQSKFRLKIRPAVRKFRRKWLVRRRSAAHCRRDVRIRQLEPVVPPRRARLIRKARAAKRLVQKIPRAISREDASRSVAAMRRGRKPQDQQLRARIAKSRNRFAPIFPIAKRPPLFAPNFFAIFHQPRTLPALNDLLVQLFQ